jgi:hypothetical protein
MSYIKENLTILKKEIPQKVTLVAITKTHPPEMIMEAYDAGHRVFGENKVQEMVGKYQSLPKDIEWHMVGHLQTNKVKYIAPFVSLIHSIDSLKLLIEINKQAAKCGRVINCLLQMHIAEEETKFGLSYNEIVELLSSNEYRTLKNVSLLGLMAMATFTDDMEQVRKEFRVLSSTFKQIKNTFFHQIDDFKILSMGMSSDYKVAIEEGSSMIRVGSIIFGERFYGAN